MSDMEPERIGVSRVRELAARHGFKFSKSMGQNFLIDANIPEKMVRLAGICESDGVLEAGPGLGALTVELSRAAGRVTSVELDERLLPILNEAIGAPANVTVVHGDILKLNLGQLVHEEMPGRIYHVCSNLPYNITTPALTAFIEAGVFKTITVMIQYEVARRICAGPGSGDYGAFSVYANYHCVPEVLFDVPPECFMPRPAVRSSVVMLRVRQERELSGGAEDLFFRIVRAAFGQRRKTLANALFSVFGADPHAGLGKDEILDCILSCGLDAMVRGEALGIAEFASLADSFLRIGLNDTNVIHRCDI